MPSAKASQSASEITLPYATIGQKLEKTTNSYAV
jgi:hypothetical protein